jgi:hypothetical protein
VLKDLSYWLNKSYQEKILLTGIIYLHRIIDPRLGGTARKNLEMFKKLCGEESYGAVVLATTMWERVPPGEGDRREQELRATGEFYKSMLDNGAHLLRHMDNRNSAMAILSHLINRGKTTVLAMQHEMSEQNLELQQTAAGKELNSEILRQTEMFNIRLRETEARMQQALEEKDDQLARDLASQQDELNQRILEAQRGREELQVTMQKLFEQKEKQFNEMRKQYEEERKQREEALQQRDEQLNEFKKALKRAEELAAAKTREYEEEIELRKKQLEETESVVGELYLRNVEALIAQKEEYEKKVRENLARAQEEEYRQRSERMKQEYETNLSLVRQRQALIQQPAFYPGAAAGARSGVGLKVGTMVAGSAAGAVAAHVAPLAIGAAAAVCVVM